jgi:hypothetical protein
MDKYKAATERIEEAGKERAERVAAAREGCVTRHAGHKSQRQDPLTHTSVRCLSSMPES